MHGGSGGEDAAAVVVVIWVRRVWASDTANHFKNRALRLVTEHLATGYRFSVANTTAWANGTVERTTLKVVNTFRVVARATRIPLKEWVRIVQVVQAALNAGYQERLQASLFNLMLGRKPYSIFSALVAPGKNEWQVNSLDTDSVVGEGSHGRA